MIRTKTVTVNPWLERTQENPSASLRLFCFPYAGGSARIFRTWGQYLPKFVEVCPVQLPGRDRRIAEPPFSNVELLAQAAAEGLRPFLDKPFVFFGHSMGALLSFELAHYLRAEFGVSPKHMLASGRRAPHLMKERSIYDLPKEELLQELEELKGTPPDVLEHPDLMELMLPLLRADFALGDTYVFRERPLLSIPITALGGLRDSTVTRADLQGWGELTTGAFSLRMFPGDHFFVHSDEFRLMDVIARELRPICEQL
jgi:medium-chain acyl-[acyl-carrier-protein] hydrolase